MNARWIDYALLTCIALPTWPLTTTWGNTPSEHYGWLLMALWAGPACWRLGHAAHPVLLIVAGALAVVGICSDLNVVRHAALALAMAAWLCARTSSMALFWAWLAGAILWMPMGGYLLLPYAGEATFALRLILMLIVVGLLWWSLWRATSTSRPAPPSTLRGRVAVLMGLVAVLAWDAIPMAPSATQIRLPADGFGVVSASVALTPGEVSMFRHVSVVKRLYVTRHGRFLVMIIDGSRDRHAIHDPAYCLRGAGWRIDRTQSLTLPGGRAMQMSASRDHATTSMVWWYARHAQRHTSPWRVMLDAAFARMTRGHVGAAPMLVLLQSVDDGTDPSVLPDIAELLGMP